MPNLRILEGTTTIAIPEGCTEAVETEHSITGSATTGDAVRAIVSTATVAR